MERGIFVKHQVIAFHITMFICDQVPSSGQLVIVEVFKHMHGVSLLHSFFGGRFDTGD